MFSTLIASIIGSLIGILGGSFLVFRFGLKLVREEAGIQFPTAKKLVESLRANAQDLEYLSHWLRVNCEKLKAEGDQTLDSFSRIVTLEERLTNALERAASVNYYEYVRDTAPEWIRAIGETVAQKVGSVIATRSTDVKNEYILLTNGAEGLTFDVNMRLDHVQDQYLEEALIFALAGLKINGSVPRGIHERRAWLKQQLDHEAMHRFLTDLGTNIAKCQWDGQVIVRRKVGTTKVTEELPTCTDVQAGARNSERTVVKAS